MRRGGEREYSTANDLHCWIVERKVLRHVESQMTVGQTSAALDE